MKILQTNFFGDPNIGLFGKCSDSICLLGNFFSEKYNKRIEDVLKTDVLPLTIANTYLIGIFCCLNSKGIVLPKIVESWELKKIKETGLNVEILKTKFTALGNLILCNDKGAIISKILKKTDKKRIEDCLGVEAAYSTIASMSNIGSCGVATNSGCLVHRDANDSEIKKIQDIVKVNVDVGTANFGSPFVGSCLLANSKGAVIGRSSTGPEVNRMMETLGYL